VVVREVFGVVRAKERESLPSLPWKISNLVVDGQVRAGKIVWGTYFMDNRDSKKKNAGASANQLGEHAFNAVRVCLCMHP
jgi:hypothetical protein